MREEDQRSDRCRIFQDLKDGKEDSLSQIGAYLLRVVCPHVAAHFPFSIPADVWDGIANVVAYKIWMKSECYDPRKGSFNAWVSEFVRHEAQSETRKRWRYARRFVHGKEIDRAAPEPDDLITALLEAITMLPPAERRVIEGRLADGKMSLAAIASELGITESQARNLMDKAKIRLRTILDPWFSSIAS